MKRETPGPTHPGFSATTAFLPLCELPLPPDMLARFLALPFSCPSVSVIPSWVSSVFALLMGLSILRSVTPDGLCPGDTFRNS